MLKIATRLVAFVFGVALATNSWSASTTLSIIINSPPSVSVSCPLASSYTAPLAAGANICTVAVSPDGWSGALSLSGTDAADFTLNGTALNVGSTALGAGSYSVTINATP
jgi:hypothetical protein